eukprot:TRINITY_DN7060_c0_g2_i1.p1 TRINITY_DN7060_c0_g2~~TRINITY_DN7060_c0_g2_i1.p1  ORF type:complete len:275 (-),score=64.45 TRINITY_DN7060_c0_g2_i1:67-891(-)
MKYGEKCRLYVDYEYGFGKYDNPHGFHASNKLIPARSKLIFELHALNPKLAKAKSSAEWLEFAEKQKEEANVLFSQKKWDEAIKLYEKTIGILEGVKKNLDQPPPADFTPEQIHKWKETNEKDLQKWKDTKVTLHNNVAACYLQKREYTHTRDTCRIVMELDPNNIKALWRYAKSYRAQDQFDEALRYLNLAYSLQPTDELKKEIDVVKVLKVRKDQSDQQAFGGFFDKLNAGLYEGQAPAPPPRWKCHLCGEEMDDIQKARHIIKKHNPENKK